MDPVSPLDTMLELNYSRATWSPSPRAPTIRRFATVAFPLTAWDVDLDVRGQPLVTLLALAAVLPPLAPSEASASCAVLPGQIAGSYASAPVVFVGTVVSTSNANREATVKIESIWRGPAMLTYVRVIGTPEPGTQATSVDRTYQAGQRYLFVPENSSSPFHDNNCTATQPYTSALASQAPAAARAPLPGGDPGPPWGINLLPWLGVGVILLLAVAGVTALRWRSGRTA